MTPAPIRSPRFVPPRRIVQLAIQMQLLDNDYAFLIINVPLRRRPNFMSSSNLDKGGDNSKSKGRGKAFSG